MLSKFIIFAVGNNLQKKFNNWIWVVNCFQNLLSLQSETTPPLRPFNAILLWIAFKIYYLCSRKQQKPFYFQAFYRCELLSKFIIFAVGNNKTAQRGGVWLVVNCFQNLLSLQSETTVVAFLEPITMLWIAFKIYYLCSRKQPWRFAPPRRPCCELLSKFIIFAVGNNQLSFSRES